MNAAPARTAFFFGQIRPRHRSSIRHFQPFARALRYTFKCRIYLGSGPSRIKLTFLFVDLWSLALACAHGNLRFEFGANLLVDRNLHVLLDLQRHREAVGNHFV